MDNVEKVARAMFRSAFGDDPLGDKAAEKLFEDHRFEYENLAQAALQSIGYEPEAFERIAERLVSQQGEPWPEGTESDRLHYWRDKCISGARDIRAALKGDSDRG